VEEAAGLHRCPSGVAVQDLAVIIVSIPGQPEWLVPCLRSLAAHAGGLDLDVVVVSNAGDDIEEFLDEHGLQARVVHCGNGGFAHANNRGYVTCDARHYLFLNPDTAILEGSLAKLVERLDRRPEVGLVGCHQVSPEGETLLTIRRFPTPIRALGEALGSERWPCRFKWQGERELRQERYTRDTRCDWTVGSFMVVPREVIECVGLMDERFFLYGEEKDFCCRITLAGWEVWHWPAVRILHHADKAGASERGEAQAALSRLIYAHKRFGPTSRTFYLAAVRLRYALRACSPGRSDRRRAARAALAAMRRGTPPPYRPVPAAALASLGETERSERPRLRLAA
jgi:N-acetylglucosaminyl-diphospho-decaprenol L-rhamnosyltransferase